MSTWPFILKQKFNLASFVAPASRRFAAILTLTAIVLLGTPAWGQLVTTDLTSQTPEDLAFTLVGDGVFIWNISFIGATSAAGTFSGGTEIIGFDEGVILSSGVVSNVIGPNTSDGKTASNSLPGDSDLTALIPGFTTHDATILEFDFIPENNVVSFQYVFTSDEYNEWVNTAFNDVFGFFLNGVNVALLPGTNIAVSINNVNEGNPFGDLATASNPHYYINNDLSDGGGSIDTEMDGLTVVLSVDAPVQAGESNHIKLAIADAGDNILDSTVFIKASSFTDQPADTDADGYPDSEDNCSMTFNPEQEDSDGDGIGDICDETPQALPLGFSLLTGGGAVAAADGGQHSFGFNARTTSTGQMEVHLEYNDGHKGKASSKNAQPSPLQIKIKGLAGNVTPIDGVGVEFDAPCTIRTLVPDNERELKTCRVLIVDNGQPGTGNKKKGTPAADQFELTVFDDGPSIYYHSGDNLALIRGNIKAHE